MSFKTKPNLYSSGDIKREAKAQLKGNWKQAVLLALIPVAFSIIFISLTTQNAANQSFGERLFSVLINIVEAFLTTGIAYSFLDFLRRCDYVIQPLQDIIQVFRGKYFSNLFLVKIVKYLFTFLWSLLFIIPGIIKSYAYSQAEFIYKDTVDRTGEQPDARACLDESQRLMKGHKMDLFVLDLSFIGWVFLSVLTLGLLNLWLTPYTSMSRVVFYENVSERYYKDNNPTAGQQSTETNGPSKSNQEIGKDPDDFRDFNDY